MSKPRNEQCKCLFAKYSRHRAFKCTLFGMNGILINPNSEELQLAIAKMAREQREDSIQEPSVAISEITPLSEKEKEELVADLLKWCDSKDSSSDENTKSLEGDASIDLCEYID